LIIHTLNAVTILLYLAVLNVPYQFFWSSLPYGLFSKRFITAYDLFVALSIATSITAIWESVHEVKVAAQLSKNRRKLVVS
jgi:hypothetical protein